MNNNNHRGEVAAIEALKDFVERAIAWVGLRERNRVSPFWAPILATTAIAVAIYAVYRLWMQPGRPPKRRKPRRRKPKQEAAPATEQLQQHQSMVPRRRSSRSSTSESRSRTPVREPRPSVLRPEPVIPLTPEEEDEEKEKGEWKLVAGRKSRGKPQGRSGQR